jgi:Fic family protein
MKLPSKFGPSMSQSIPEPLLRFDPTTFTDKLTVIEGLRAKFQDAVRANRILPNSLEAIRVELTYHSNAIEGSTLSLRDIQLVIEGREPNTGKLLREIYEARNHDRALRKIEAWATETRDDQPLTEKNLLDIHGYVMADIDTVNAGMFRSDRVLIRGTRFVPPGSHRFGELIPRLFQFANESGIHPVIQAAELHYNIVAVHPFADENGRSARLMMNYHFLRKGYPLVIIPVEKRPEYLAALDEANSGLTDSFSAFLIDCVLASFTKILGDD